jgi:hypothetical protein
MNAPNKSSNALSARERSELVEGNGVSVSSAIEQISTYLFFIGCVVRPKWIREFESLPTF